MTRKTDSLAYPADPLAAIRELQELNPRPGAGQGFTPEPPAPPPTRSSAPPQTRPASIAVADAGGSEGSSATGNEEGSSPGRRCNKPANRAYADQADAELRGYGDPMAEAVLGMLSRPYTADSR